MKRISTVFTALVCVAAVLFLSSCSALSSGETIEITKENFSTYFSGDIYFSEIEKRAGILGAEYSANMNIKVKPNQNLKVNNLQVKIMLPTIFRSYSIDSNITEESYIHYLEINLSQDGTYEKVISCSGSMLYPSTSDDYFLIEEVYGSIVVNN